MPSLRTNVTRKALTEGWQFRQRNGKGGGREYAYNSLPTQTQAALHKIDCALESSLDLNLEKSGSATCCISNELQLPGLIQLALAQVKAVEESKARPATNQTTLS